VLAAWVLVLAFPEVLLPPEERPAMLGLILGAAGLLILCELFPLKRVYRLPNAVFGLGWLFLAVQLVRVLTPVPESAAVVLGPPFRGEWNVFHGGRSALLNHHYLVPGQQHALDLDRSLNGPPPEAEASGLEACPAFREPLYAPADGRVVQAVDQYRDNPIGQTDEVHLTGNYLVIEIGQGRYVLLAHLLKGSVRVRKGERVRAGQQVAQCGNSGNTSEPHLHLQVQDRPGFSEHARTFPILFRGVTLRRGGRERTGQLVDPRRNDRRVASDAHRSRPNSRRPR
jgi:hypothetical protein